MKRRILPSHRDHQLTAQYVDERHTDALQLYRGTLIRLEWVVEVCVNKFQIRSAVDSTFNRMTSTIVCDAERVTCRSDANGRCVPRLELCEAIQHKRADNDGREVVVIGWDVFDRQGDDDNLDIGYARRGHCDWFMFWHEP